jgi:hypothetical protein
MSIATRVSGRLLDAWGRMTVAELALFVGFFGAGAVPVNLYRRAERLAEVLAAASDLAGPNSACGRTARRRAEFAAIWDENAPTIGRASDGAKARSRARYANMRKRRRRRAAVRTAMSMAAA